MQSGKNIRVPVGLFVIFLVFTTMLLGSCSGNTHKTLVNKFDGYSINYPNGWYIFSSNEIGSATDISQASLGELGIDTARLNIVAFQNLENLSVVQWHKMYVSDIQPDREWNISDVTFFQYTETVHDFIYYSPLYKPSVVYIAGDQRVYRIIEFCESDDCILLDALIEAFTLIRPRSDSSQLPLPIYSMQGEYENALTEQGQHLDKDSPVPLEAPWNNGDTYVLSGNFYGEGAHSDSFNDYYATDWNKMNTSCDEDRGEPVLAAGTGIAVFVRNWDPGAGSGGKIVRIQSNQDPSVTFAIYHLDNVNVSQNESISTLPKQIGTNGKTGVVGCAHIHLRVSQTVNNVIYSIRPGNLSGQSVYKLAEITSHN